MALSIGILNAMEMETLGHLAGPAASIIGAVEAVGAVDVAAPLVLAFYGTPIPVAHQTLAVTVVRILRDDAIRR